MLTARFCNALKYAPLTGWCLLAGLWVVSIFGYLSYSFSVNWQNAYCNVGVAYGTVALLAWPTRAPLGWHWSVGKQERCLADVVGRFHHMALYDDQGHWLLAHYECPLPFLLTLAIPVAIGPLVGWRFRLWMLLTWLAWTGIECAYYLQHW